MRWSIPERFVQKGRAYVDEGRVTTLSYDRQLEEWYAEVIGTKRYQVVLDGTVKEQDRCTCPAWESRGYCKHTVAVELYLRDLGYQRVMANNHSLQGLQQSPNISEKLVTTLTNTLTKHANELSPLAIKVVLESDKGPFDDASIGSLTVSLKIGYQGGKLYIVRDITNFLLKYEQTGVYETKQANYYLSSEAFDSDAIAFIESLLVLMKHQRKLLAYDRGMTLPSKSLLVPKFLIKKWLDDALFDASLIENKMTGTLSPHPLRWEDDLPYQGFISEDNQGVISVKLEPNYDVFFTEENFFYHEGAFSELAYKQLELFRIIQTTLKKVSDNTLVFIQAQRQPFFEVIYPQLKMISQLTFSDSFEIEWVEEELSSALYLTQTDQLLEAQAVFSYGEYSFYYPERSNDYDVIIQRDIPTETRLARQLEASGFITSSGVLQKQFPEKETLYEFFTKELPSYRELFDQVELEDSIEELFLEGMKYQPAMTIDIERSWLDVKFDISGISEQEVDGVLTSLVKGEKFHTLANGQMMSLENDSYQRLAEQLKKMASRPSFNFGHLQLPKYQSIVLSQQLLETDNVTLEPAFEQMVQDLREFDQRPIAVPSTFVGELRPYQLTGYRWLTMLQDYGFGGILADDMGLGKTIQTISYCLHVKEKEAEAEPILIIAPASLVYNWKKEFERFAPSLTIAIISGDALSRQEKLEKWEQFDIVLTSYGTYRQDEELYRKRRCHTLFLDEAQMVKNTNTKTFQAIKRANASHRFALSGTPIENKVDEIWAIFYLLMPGLLPSFKKFQSLNTEDIRQLIRPFILRRTKQEVLTELPDKVENTIYSELTPEQKVVYLAQLKEIQEQMNGMNTEQFRENRFSILSGITRLRQICCSPELFMPDYQGESGKLKQLEALVTSALASGRRMLIFSQFTSMLSIIEERMAQMGQEVFYLRGSTPSAKRQEMVDAFNAGEHNIFLISLKAGGTGLNLTGADTVILYDLWWNPAVEEQATGRAHRMGQKKEVEVWRLVAEGTIEEKIVSLQAQKKSLFTDILGSSSSQLTEQDIRALLLE
ncbi:DEAD/DEAH box helicase [Vagococcus xieshaowenii]|uniref:Snf2 family helicase n=1 Tax=Vagococcus xieshaowenii TaxID=2562451 RepID=A0AAJ5EGA8_9ENTE|nr:DEAD/DEAH box helicase [Vagococcus xieshaowenii]QCA27948.1 Snf2 family helicase [Vagococcus xieshaowenii]TFZ41284.1 Snf2 family helicase [Vagococcus xieshaowenii]